MVLALYGSGALGRDIKYIAKDENKWDRIVFIDDIQTGELLGCTIYSFQEFKKIFKPEEVRFMVTVGEPRFRREIYEKMKLAGYTGAVIKHPTAFVADDVILEEGAVIFPGAYIGSYAKIGINFQASVNASIGHDTVIGDHIRIGSGAFIGGHTKIGNSVNVGANAMVTDRISIGNESVIAPGASVFTSVPDKATAAGNPARIVDENRQAYLFAPSSNTAAEKEKLSTGSVAERYWDVFSGCFTGIEFNPVSFRFRDSGWDSITQMSLVSRIEEEFGISLKGREVLKVNSYEAGLKMVKKKLGESSAE